MQDTDSNPTHIACSTRRTPMHMHASSHVSPRPCADKRVASACDRSTSVQYTGDNLDTSARRTQPLREHSGSPRPSPCPPVCRTQPAHLSAHAPTHPRTPPPDRRHREGRRATVCPCFQRPPNCPCDLGEPSIPHPCTPRCARWRIAIEMNHGHPCHPSPRFVRVHRRTRISCRWERSR